MLTLSLSLSLSLSVRQALKHPHPPPFTHSVTNNKVSHLVSHQQHTHSVTKPLPSLTQRESGLREWDQMSDSFLIFCYPYSVVKSWNYAFFLRMIRSLYEKWVWSVWKLHFKKYKTIHVDFFTVISKNHHGKTVQAIQNPFSI